MKINKKNIIVLILILLIFLYLKNKRFYFKETKKDIKDKGYFAKI